MKKKRPSIQKFWKSALSNLYVKIVLAILWILFLIAIVIWGSASIGYGTGRYSML